MSKRYSPAQKAAIAAAYARKAQYGSNKYYKKPAYKKPAYNKYANYKSVKGYGKYTGMGSRIGSVLGEGAERLIEFGGGLASVLGFGDYVQPGFRVQKNSFLNGGNDPPTIKNAKDGRFILRHREFLRDVITGAANAFNLVSIPINPGIVTSFPWLAAVAQAFEQYKLRGMIFEFKSTSADALSSTNTALGTVVMATEYDSTRPNFANKQQMENHQFASSARQSSSMYHPIECDRSQTPISELYVRTGSPSDSTDNDLDLRLSDWGNFQIATTGQQAANVNIGELWVTYEVEFLKPCINENGPIQLASFYRSDDSSYTTTNYLGNPATQKANTGNNIGMDLSVGNIIRWPKGTYGCFLCLIEWTGSALVNQTIPTFAGSIITEGVTLGATISPFSTVLSAPLNTEQASKMVVAFLVQCYGQTATGAGPGVVISGGTLPSGPLGVKFYVASVMDGLINANNPPLPEELEEDEEFQKYLAEEVAKLKLNYIESHTPQQIEDTPTPKSEVKEEDLIDKFSGMDSSQLLGFLQKVKEHKTSQQTGSTSK